MGEIDYEKRSRKKKVLRRRDQEGLHDKVNSHRGRTIKRKGFSIRDNKEPINRELREGGDIARSVQSLGGGKASQLITLLKGQLASNENQINELERINSSLRGAIAQMEEIETDLKKPDEA